MCLIYLVPSPDIFETLRTSFMPLPSERLPQEVFAYHVRSAIDAKSLANLSEVADIGMSESLYNERFHDNTKFRVYTDEMFRQRARAHLYTFGDPRESEGREEPNPFFYEEPETRSWSKYRSPFFDVVSGPEGEGPFRRTNKPRIIELPDAITKVEVGDMPWVFVLTEKGEIHITGALLEEEHEIIHNIPEEDCSLCEGVTLQTVEVDTGNIEGHVFSLTNEPYWREYEEEWRRQNPSREKTVVDISVDEQFYALDNYGKVRIWHVDDQQLDFFESATSFSAPLHVHRHSGGRYDSSNMIRAPVTKIGGDNVMFKGSGLCLHSGQEDPAPLGVSIYLEVPGTSTVQAWANTRFQTVYLMSDGTVTAVNFRYGQSDRDSQANKFDPSWVDPLPAVNSMGRLVRISGCSRGIALLTERGEVVTALGSQLTEVEKVAGLPDIASVSISNTHCLALSQDGDVYCWGGERDLNGCMGLGTMEEAEKLGAVIENRVEGDDGLVWTFHYLVVEKPTKMKLPGRAYAVSAGTNQSAVLVYDEKYP